MSSRFSINSEAYASELIENLEEVGHDQMIAENASSKPPPLMKGLIR